MIYSYNLFIQEMRSILVDITSQYINSENSMENRNDMLSKINLHLDKLIAEKLPNTNNISLKCFFVKNSETNKEELSIKPQTIATYLYLHGYDSSTFIDLDTNLDYYNFIQGHQEYHFERSMIDGYIQINVKIETKLDNPIDINTYNKDYIKNNEPIKFHKSDSLKELDEIIDKEDTE